MYKIKKIIIIIAFLFFTAGCSYSKKESSVSIQLGRVDYAAHGTKSFALITVALVDHTIIATYIDEYLFIASDIAIPIANSEGMSGNVIVGSVLASKRVNNTVYSKNMQTLGGATKNIDDSFSNIENYVKGKTIEELEDIINGKTKEEILSDGIVAGCTLEDTLGYLEGIIAASKEALNNNSVLYSGDTSKLTLQQIDYATHETNGFAITSVLSNEKNTIVGCYIDEYQYLSSDTAIPLANYEGMATSITEGYVLASKRVNNESYSQNMKNITNATKSMVQNYQLIEDFVVGKTVEELQNKIDGKTSETVVNENIVAGCTLTDTLRYIESVIAAMSN